MADLQGFITQQQVRVSNYLNCALSGDKFSPALNASSNQLLAAMRYSLLDGGKRIRPILTYAAAQAVNQITPATDVFAASLECIHAYSLIHDDLPSMDNDALRRGKPTCHIAFDEATAVLAGDALQCFAFESIINADIDPSIALEALKILSNASGINGMVLGQAIDLASVEKALPIEQLEQMHNFKTGALIKASVLMGGLSAKAKEPELKQLDRYAEAVGLAFQVQDDIIDVISDTQTLGKPQGSDAEHNKPTYVTLLGLEGAKAKAQELVQQAEQALSGFGHKAVHLRQLANYIVNRDH